MEAIKKSMSYIPFRERDETTFISSGKPLVAIIAEAKWQGRPVILFVEGVRTNGSGVLEFPSQVDIFVLKSEPSIMLILSIFYVDFL